MPAPVPIPGDEVDRLRVLRDYGILDTGPEAAFDEMTRLAAHICGTPIALLGFIDEQRQWFKSRVGMDAVDTPRDLTFCAHAIMRPDLMEIPDATLDQRFADHPMVTTDPKIRFYAGAPLVSPGGHALGTLCVMDREPRTLTGEQREALTVLARQVIRQLEFKHHVDSERQEIQRMKQAFVSNVSHELRTPLTSIRGSLTLLTSGALGEIPPDQRELIEIAERNTVRLITLINDILDLERISAGKIELKLAKVDVASVVTRAVEAVAAFAQAAQVGIDVDSIGCVIWADTDRMVQVLVNLLSNAIKFSPPGGRVRVVDVPRGSVCEIRVQDRGRGVPASHRDTIFERFRQVDASDTKDKGGTGLGLAICRAIVEQHGGSIGVESAEGQGSQFWFRIPVAPGQYDSLHDGVDPRNVLIVEDDVVLLDVMARQLSGRGINLRTATGGQEAFRLARERKPGLVVMDVDMPHGDGYSLVESFRREKDLRDLPLIVYTGLDLSDSDRARLQLGQTRFLTKSKGTSQDIHTLIDDLL